MPPCQKVKFVCRQCGSDRVENDAWAEWDIETQAWVLAAQCDADFCEDCEEEVKLEEIAADTPVFHLGSRYVGDSDAPTFVIWNHEENEEFGEFAAHEEAIAALTEQNRKAREKHEAALALPKFSVLIRQYVEEVADVEVKAASVEEAIQNALRDAGEADWRDGCDIKDPEACAVENEKGELVWKLSRSD
jgi:hypothetical protein